MKAEPKKESSRDQIVPRGDFQCACGCELRLSRGDLDDALKSALPFGGKPRTYGVTYTNFAQPSRQPKREESEPIEKQLCSSCRYVVVEIPSFAASLLRERDAPWPCCQKCRT